MSTDERLIHCKDHSVLLRMLKCKVERCVELVDGCIHETKSEDTIKLPDDFFESWEGGAQ